MLIRRRVLPLTVIAVAAALGAAALAGVSVAAPSRAAGPPSAEALLSRSAAALKKATSFHFDMAAHTAARSDGSLSAAQLKKAVQPVDITASGDLSDGATVLAGKMASSGQTIAAELRAGGTELYINFLGTWYGTKDTKSKSSKDSGLSIDLSTKDVNNLLSDLLKNGLDGKVTEGPDIDGVATWKVTGSFDAAALAKAGKKTGASIDTTGLSQLADKADVTLLIGRKDELLRRMDVVESLSGPDLTKAKSTTGGLVPLPAAGTKGVKSVSVSLTIELSKFGQKVSLERPSSFKPLEKMIEALLGGALSPTKTTKTA